MRTKGEKIEIQGEKKETGRRKCWESGNTWGIGSVRNVGSWVWGQLRRSNPYPKVDFGQEFPVSAGLWKRCHLPKGTMPRLDCSGVKPSAFPKPSFGEERENLVPCSNELINNPSSKRIHAGFSVGSRWLYRPDFPSFWQDTGSFPAAPSAGIFGLFPFGFSRQYFCPRASQTGRGKQKQLRGRGDEKTPRFGVAPTFRVKKKNPKKGNQEPPQSQGVFSKPIAPSQIPFRCSRD